VPGALAATTKGAAAAANRPIPPRLRPGDTLGLIEPATATDDAFDVTLVEEAVAALGLKSKRGKHVLSRFGYLAGGDRERAVDVNAMYADSDVRAILAIRGGWGCARILPFLDYAVIRANPKLLIGYSDITALHLAVAARGGAITLHAPNGASAWGAQSVTSFKEIAFDGAMPTYSNPAATEDRLAQRKWRVQTITPGVARGRLLGGNLTVLTALVGTPYFPDFRGAILLLEDVDEAEYRVDRMLTQLALAGILSSVAGVVFGHCTDCKGSSSGVYGGFTISDVLRQHLGALGVPAFQGSFFGHLENQFTLPLGTLAEIDAAAGTIRLLEPAVR
jgi:muramoyltetrapeptide carboxypeptidase